MADDPMTQIDPRALRTACGRFATGVTVLTTDTKDGGHGMTANAFMSVSLEPPLLTISLAKGARMLDLVRQSGRYAVNILSHEMEPLAMHFAGRHNDDFAEVLEKRDGYWVVPGCSAVFLTEVVQEIEVGDHVLFIGQVTDFEENSDTAPLVFCAGLFHALDRAA